MNDDVTTRPELTLGQPIVNDFIGNASITIRQPVYKTIKGLSFSQKTRIAEDIRQSIYLDRIRVDGMFICESGICAYLVLAVDLINERLDAIEERIENC